MQTQKWVSTISTFLLDRVKLKHLIVDVSIIYRLIAKSFCLQMEAFVKLQTQIKRPEKKIFWEFSDP